MIHIFETTMFWYCTGIRVMLSECLPRFKNGDAWAVIIFWLKSHMLTHRQAKRKGDVDFVLHGVTCVQYCTPKIITNAFDN